MGRPADRLAGRPAQARTAADGLPTLPPRAELRPAQPTRGPGTPATGRPTLTAARVPQSSLHSEKGLGVTTLSTLYAGVLLSSMLLPPLLIQRLGCKWTIVLSMCGYVAFSLGNFYASW
ncbi:Protein unc-93-A [Galemys pyrenaicus]|uniref:Protein unc-93-A n=1 Tax=Galemys pyrenaicus TaxID=202257 RepID=A0A8J5ZAK7_GALPY|nr:Protein unc-93-A [Galemys pyrenaicus]